MYTILILASPCYRDWPTSKRAATARAFACSEASAEQLQAVDLVNKMFLSQSKGDA